MHVKKGSLTKEGKVCSPIDDLITTWQWPYLFVEYVFNVATPNPLYWDSTFKETLDSGKVIYHRVNDVFLVIMFF